MIKPPSIVLFAYEHFKIEFCVIGFFYPTLEMYDMVPF